MSGGVLDNLQSGAKCPHSTEGGGGGGGCPQCVAVTCDERFAACTCESAVWCVRFTVIK